jgi:uncharacterized protein (DUF983 family)
MSSAVLESFACPECRTRVSVADDEPRCSLCGTRFRKDGTKDGFSPVGSPARWFNILGAVLVAGGFVALLLRAPVWQIWLPFAVARSVIFANDLRTGVCAFSVLGLGFWPTAYRDESPTRFRWAMSIQGLVLAGFWFAVTVAFRG